MPAADLDSAWAFGMNQAVAQQLVFGRDIIFTYGPYAPVLTKMYHPGTDRLMMAGSLYFSLSFIFALFVNFRTAKWYLQLLLLAALSAITLAADALFFFYPLLAGVYLHREFVATEVVQRVGRGNVVILVLLFAPLGLLPLIKGSMLIGSLAITVLSALLLLKAGQSRLAIAVCAAPLCSMILFWLMAGQPLSALLDFITSMLPIMSGYTEAMGIKGNRRDILYYVLSAAALAGMVFIGQRTSFKSRVPVTLMFVCIAFLAFKAGFVRHDAHAVISGHLIFLAAILAATLISWGRALVLLVVTASTMTFIGQQHVKVSVRDIYDNLSAAYVNAWQGMKLRTLEPEALRRNYEQRVSAIHDMAGLPRLDGTTDIYSHDQSSLIASGNNWNPRPILQSYSAYTSQLAERNRDHLLGDKRPDNILFKIQAIDGRLPALEDGASWPVLLADYEPKSFTKGYLLLRHRAAGANAEHKSGGDRFKRTFSIGENIELPKSEGVHYARVHLKKSLLGTIANTLFKPSQLEIRLGMQDGSTRKYRMVANMAESGFVISPLIFDTTDFALLYAEPRLLNDKKVSSITIEPTEHRAFWQNSIEIDITTIAYDANPNVIARFSFAPPLPASDFAPAAIAEKCDGSIDFANGISPDAGQVKSAGILSTSGWLVPSIAKTELADKIYLVLTDAEGRRWFFETRRLTRPDVGAHFQNAALSSSGYEVTADVSGLKGVYSIGLAYAKGDALLVCPQFKADLKIAGR